MSQTVKNIAILGSTGSIGTQTLDVIASHPERFRASLLTAGRNARLLVEQALRFRPSRVVIASEELAADVEQALAGTGIEVLAGSRAIAQAAAAPEIDTVVTAMVGYTGLEPTMSAIEAGKTIALANKETLVVAGELITSMVGHRQALGDSSCRIIPVDSEHSAIFQCLEGEARSAVHKLILTASGGPFRTLPTEKLAGVTAADALRHPNWTMGAKVTIDSASMMNKGFEMIEARWLFGFGPEQIQIVVHPQSVVHSMVEYRDGSIKAQLGAPDMHLPISHALSYPDRLPGAERFLRLSDYASLTFEAPDMEKFPLLGFAYEALSRGGNMPCILNAANEVANAAFLRGELRFTDMAPLAEETMRCSGFIASPGYDELVATHQEATARACEILKQKF